MFMMLSISIYKNDVLYEWYIFREIHFTTYMLKFHFFNIVIHTNEYGSEGVSNAYALPPCFLFPYT